MAMKPELRLLNVQGNNLTAERLAMLYERLTGKKPTEAELERARAKLAAAAAAQR